MAFNPAQNPLLNDFQGGQMTDLPALTAALDGTELMELVAPGNASDGVNYSITTARLAGFVVAPVPTIIQSGSAYNSVASDVRILIDLAVAGPITITLLNSSRYLQPILVKDIAGNVDGTNPITVVFSNGQTVDGLSTVVLSNPYAWFWFNPLAAGNFYET